MNLFCVGISHHTAKVETRERYALQRSEEVLRTESGCDEALMLATCNRVEVYASAGAPVATERITHCLVRGGAGTAGGRSRLLSARRRRMRPASFSRRRPASIRW